MLKTFFADVRNILLSWVGGMILIVLWAHFALGVIPSDFFVSPEMKKISPLITFLCFFISYPYRFGGNIYSLWGGVNPDGDVYSLIELHASGRNVRSLVTLSFFSSAKENKDSIFGVNLFSRADELFLFCGINAFCFSNELVVVVFGFNFLSRTSSALFSFFGANILSTSKNYVLVALGINVFCMSQEDIVTFFGFNVLSFSCRYISTFLGINIFSFSRGIIATLIGSNILCKARNKSYLGFGIPLFMNVGGESELSWEKTKENL